MPPSPLLTVQHLLLERPLHIPEAATFAMKTQANTKKKPKKNMWMSLPPIVLRKVLLNVRGTDFLSLGRVCRYWNQMYGVLLQDNSALKLKYDSDPLLRNYLRHLANTFIGTPESSPDYWVKLFQLGSQNLRRAENRYLGRLRTNPCSMDRCRVAIFNNILYVMNYRFLEAYRLFDNLQGELVASHEKDSFVLTDLKALHVIAPKYESHPLFPYIFLSYGEEFELWIHDTLLQRFSLRLRERNFYSLHHFKSHGNLIAFVTSSRIILYQLQPPSKSPAKVSQLSPLFHTYEPALFEFHDSGFLVLRSDSIEYYTIDSVSQISLCYRHCFCHLPGSIHSLPLSNESFILGELHIVNQSCMFYDPQSKQAFVLRNFSSRQDVSLQRSECTPLQFNFLVYFYVDPMSWSNISNKRIRPELNRRCEKLAKLDPNCEKMAYFCRPNQSILAFTENEKDEMVWIVCFIERD